MKKQIFLSTIVGFLLFYSIPSVHAVPTPINLSSWVVEDYATLNGPANWTVSQLGTSVFQSLNSDPSIFRSDNAIDVTNKEIQGIFRVDGTTDDDYMGFVFGYQNRGQFYLFDWRKGTQCCLSSGEVLQPGMSLKTVNTGSGAVDPSIEDLAALLPNPSIIVHRTNSTPWAVSTDYTFRLNFMSGQFEVEISQGSTTLENWVVNDSTFVNGDFGFYNNSQNGVTYNAFTQETITNPIPEPSTVLLFGTGLAGLVAWRWKTIKQT